MVTRRVAGLSLFELLMTLAILSLLASLAAPSFSTMLAEQRLRYVGTELRLALTAARSEAVKRNEGVSLIRQGSDWSRGWCLASSTTSTCPEQPIQLFEIPMESVTLSTENTVAGATVGFNAWGRVANCPKFTFSTVAADSTCSLCLLVTMDGRVQSHAGGCPDTCDDSAEAEPINWSGACS